MVVTVIARLKMLPGKEDQALEHCRQMATAVEANEPKTLGYFCHRSRQDPSEVVFFETYADRDALQAHGQTPHMGEFRARLGELFDLTQVKIEQMERLGGFARAGDG